MEAAGRVQVFARVRPAVANEAGFACAVELSGDPRVVRVRNDSDIVDRVLQGHAADAAVGSAEAREFTFDAVFPSDSSQKEVFMQLGLPVLRECLKGFNGTILAYGQTGSGKTHSLLHQGQKSEDAGLLPRLVASLFVQVVQDFANVYEIEAAAVQVYNEQIDDLLHPDHQNGAGQNLQVQQGGVVPGLTWIKCARPDVMLDAFTRARANVVYAETKMNKASSRSHAVFQIKISKRQRVTGATDGRAQRLQCTLARLNVVDLAGSERVKKSGVEGMQFKEATAINKSLLAFGNVVSALAAKKTHVPLRDSKLTRILDGSIGGNCKTALLVCASPAMENASETLSTFEFASRAMRVEVDARVNTSIIEVSAKALLADLSVDVEQLGGVPLGPELEALRRKSQEAAEKAKAEADQRDKAVAEAQSSAKHFEGAAREAEQQAKRWRGEAEALRSAQEHAEAEAKRLKNAVDTAEASAGQWKSASQAHQQEAERLRKAAEDAQRTAEEWRAAAEQRANEVKELRQKEAEARKKEAAQAAATVAKEALERKKTQEALTQERQKAQDAASQERQKAQETVTHERQQAQEQVAKERQKAQETVTQERKKAQEEVEKALERASLAERALAEWQDRATSAQSTAEALREEADRATDAGRKTSEALQAAHAEAEILRQLGEEKAQQNATLEAQLALLTEELQQREALLDEARAELERFRHEVAERETRLRQEHLDELEATQRRHAAELARLESDIQEVRLKAETDLEEERRRHVNEMTTLEVMISHKAALWEDERSQMEQQHRVAMDQQREEFLQRLQAGHDDFQGRLQELERQSSAERAALLQQLDDQCEELERSEARWRLMKDSAVREVSMSSSEQQKRLAATFKAARCVAAVKETQLREAHEELAKRFASRESREEDVQQIVEQRRSLEEQRRGLQVRERQVEDLCRELNNRDITDKIFGPADIRLGRVFGSPCRRGSVPPLPGKKLGELQSSFAERDQRRRTFSRQHSMESSPSVSARVLAGTQPLLVR